MKRIPSGLVVVAAVVAMGALASACNVTPNAASVNGITISVASINAEMNAYDTSSAAACLLEVKNPQVLAIAGDGSGGAGTKQSSFAGAVLSSDVDNMLAAQLAVSDKLKLTTADVSTAENHLVSSLDGGITNAVQTASSGGTASHCVTSNGTPLTGQVLLNALPATLRDAEVANLAVYEALLARGADLSDAAVLNYYAANQSQFTTVCVSAIAVGTQAEAEQVVTELHGGASFSQLATTTSTDAASAAQGGQLGCQFTEAEVLQDLQLTSVTVGQPTAPIQAGPQTWQVYEVTSQTVIPVTDAASVIREDLLHQTVNTQRVSAQLVIYAHHSSVTVNPQYGSWSVVGISPPKSPPTRFLLPLAASSVTVPTPSGSTTPGTSPSGSGTSATTTTTTAGG